MRQIFIYGPPGVGKSTVGKQIAKSLAVKFLDIDELIEEKVNKPIAQIFSEHGEDVFRAYESEVILSIIQNDPSVIALGGGALLDPEIRKNVENNGIVLFLRGNKKSLISRLNHSQLNRPLLPEGNRQRLEKLLKQRQDHYDSFDLCVETDDKSVEEILNESRILLGRYHVPNMISPYDVIVEQGNSCRIGGELRYRNLKGPIIVITDTNVEPLYLDIVVQSIHKEGYQVHGYSLPAGESYKTIDSVLRLWMEFSKRKIERNSTVVALGGGVIGDLVGFAAATYLRGVHWVNVPSTILSMVDASIGGKTGADLPHGKNLIGSFYPPSLVSVDPSLIKTLPFVESKSGIAEVVKHGVIGDRVLFNSCMSGWDNIWLSLDRIINRAISVKIDVITIDPYEENIRAILNYGHTLGHAIEKASNYSTRHGEAVAIGMVAATSLAERIGVARKGLTDEIKSCLLKLGLPIKIPANISQSSLIDAMLFDKKKDAGKIQLVLPVELGDVKFGVEIDDLQDLINAAK